MKIAMLQLGYESNTFVSGRAQIPDLGSGGWIRAETVIPTFTAEEICHLSQMYYVTNLCHLHNGLLKLVTQLLQPSEGRFKESLTNVNCKSENESEVAQSCQTLCDPMDCSPPGSSVHGIFQT